MIINSVGKIVSGGGELTFESASELVNNDKINGVDKANYISGTSYGVISFNRPWDLPKKSIGFVAYISDYRSGSYSKYPKLSGTTLLSVEIDWENKTILRSDGDSDKKYWFPTDNTLYVQVFSAGIEWTDYGQASGVVISST